MIHAVTLPDRGTFDAWRDAARRAISHGIAPDRLDWAGGAGLFGGDPLPGVRPGFDLRVPPGFVTLAGSVIWHAAPERFGLLYQALWRLVQGQGDPVSQADPLGRRLHLMAKAVGRDIHKMHAFVRFREMPGPGQDPGPRRRFAAWFEPDHLTLEPGSRFFAKRFADMDWLIATPHLTARFDAGMLTFHPGGARPDLPEDASETLWATYFANIFNPARVKLDAMRSEMPKKDWRNLPETRLIPEMLKDAEARVARMAAAGGSTPRPGAAAVSTRYRAAMPQVADLPETLEQAADAARQCRRCALCEGATQTVWGAGDPQAALMILGEAPGDQEDLAGQPFVGPAGQVLQAAMAQAGLNPAQVWLTNAVKHFKFAPRGKQRLHQSPDRAEIDHCRWWLGLEIGFIRPRLVVALGATAAYALTGDGGALTPRRGGVEPGLHDGPVLISWHPSHILRLPDTAARAQAQAELQADLARAVQLLA